MWLRTISPRIRENQKEILVQIPQLAVSLHSYHNNNNINEDDADKSLTPILSPEELQRLLSGEVLLDRVVHSLDEHAGQAGPLQQVGHGGGVTEGVYRPAGSRLHPCQAQASRSPQVAAFVPLARHLINPKRKL